MGETSHLRYLCYPRLNSLRLGALGENNSEGSLAKAQRRRGKIDSDLDSDSDSDSDSDQTYLSYL